MSSFRARRGYALKFGVSFAVWRVCVDVSLDLLDWRWERPYNDGNFGVWIGPLWIDGFVFGGANG